MSILPSADREYLDSKQIRFEEVTDGTTSAIILKSWKLPDGQFDAGAADILVVLPSGYPDVAPDMFHLLPWVKLAKAGRYPNAADQPVSFAGKSWQRWSRHNAEWRPGVDGIWTMIKRIEHALAIAA
jgi:hypothetical protein